MHVFRALPTHSTYDARPQIAPSFPGKVEAVRGERDTLRQQRAALEDKLADVEKFQSSRRGQALVRMEQDLAQERMARVELEADRDDLESQLAAALQAQTARS